MASRAYEQAISDAKRNLWLIWGSAVAGLVLLGMFGMSISDGEVPMTLPMPFRIAIFGGAAFMGAMAIGIPRHTLKNRVLMEHVRSKSRNELTTGKASKDTGGMTPKEERLSALAQLYMRPFMMSIALGETVGLLGVVFYRYGTFDNLIKAQFVAKMNAMGIDFTAYVFRLTVSPLQ